MTEKINPIDKSTNVYHEIVLNYDNKSVYINDKFVKTTKMEFKILDLFINNKNKVLTKDYLQNALWISMDSEKNYQNLLQAHIKNIRKKITKNSQRTYIQSIYGIGYIFT